jgi:hypothetical protein
MVIRGKAARTIVKAGTEGKALRSVPKGKSRQWRDLRGEGHESYARMGYPLRAVAVLRPGTRT